MISLRNFILEDAEMLQQQRYHRMTVENIKAMINRWNTGNFHGHYFVMLAIFHEEQMVGMVSLYHFTEHIVSIRPEIFPEHRRKGYATYALQHLMEMAGELGYTIVSQQVRVDNEVAISLHKSLGFETDGYLYTDRNGAKVMVYLKTID